MRSRKKQNKLKRNQITKLLTITLIIVGVFSFSHTGYGASRQLTSTELPRVKAESDTDEILDSYKAYLNFVVDIGRQTDSASTQKLVRKFAELEKRSPESAARFLKGLRVELLDKAERMGRSDGRVSSSSVELRKWVNRFMKDWAREADEHLFRASSSELARK